MPSLWLINKELGRRKNTGGHLLDAETLAKRARLGESGPDLAMQLVHS